MRVSPPTRLSLLSTGIGLNPGDVFPSIVPQRVSSTSRPTRKKSRHQQTAPFSRWSGGRSG